MSRRNDNIPAYDPLRRCQDPPPSPTENTIIKQMFFVLQRPDGPPMSLLSAHATKQTKATIQWHRGRIYENQSLRRS